MSPPLKIYEPPAESLADLPIGIVIPVYNRRTILLETLPYVLAQTHLPTRLVVVDDGSTDGTADAIETFLLQESPPIDWRVIRGDFPNVAQVRASGFKEVDDLPLVAFLDSDDHWPSDFLQRAATELANHPNAVAASTNRYYVDRTDAPPQAEDLSEMVANPVPWIFRHGAGIASCTLLRTCAARAAGGWQSELEVSEDDELFCQVALEGDWRHLPGKPVTFHLGDGPLRHEENNLCRKFPDCEYRWAKAYEQIYQRLCERNPAINRRPLHAQMANRWSTAGKQQLRLGETKKARECFARALYWDPTHLRSWRRLATARVKKVG